jgi:hypothetical protein
MSPTQHISIFAFTRYFCLSKFSGNLIPMEQKEVLKIQCFPEARHCTWQLFQQVTAYDVFSLSSNKTELYA